MGDLYRWASTMGERYAMPIYFDTLDEALKIRRLRVTIYDTRLDRVTKYVHALVCSAFHGPKSDPKLQVRHLNGDRLDNRPENLRWGTCSENMHDRVRHGNSPQAAKTHCPHGHEYNAVNTHFSPRGQRVCRKCGALYWRRKHGARTPEEES